MARWGILGLGAIGGLFASHLKLAQQSVTIIKDQQRCSLARQQSLKLFGLSGPYQCEYPVSNSTKDIDILLICVKSYQVTNALQAIQLAPDTELLTLHNGMGTGEWITQNLPSHKLWLGTTTHGARRHKQGIEHTGLGVTAIGSATPSTPEPGWLNVLKEALPKVEWSTSINERLWQKLAINCVINPLTALHNCRNGALLEHSFHNQVMTICQEVSNVAKTEGINIGSRQLFDQVIEVSKLTANNYSSMHQDIHHQRNTEIDYINGYLVSKAAQHQIAVPENQWLMEQIHQKENSYV